MRQVEARLLVEPRAGVVVAATGGVRKLRVASPSAGGAAAHGSLFVSGIAREDLLSLRVREERAGRSVAGRQVGPA